MNYHTLTIVENYNFDETWPRFVTLLYNLFPSLDTLEKSGLPIWRDFEEPWAIFSDIESGLIPQILEFTQNEDESFIHPSARIGKGVEIEGSCYIGENVEIRHSAFIRKGSWLCKGSLVGHSSEVKNSILLPGSKAPHFNYVGDSILGTGVNLGAGTKLSNVRNDGRGVYVTLQDGSRRDSRLRKLGALIGDGSQLGCNVVTNPGTMILPGKMIDPNETVSRFIG